MKCSMLIGVLGALLIGIPAAARAQAPIVGQPYQVPAEYSAYVPGSVVNYGGYSYVIQGNGTMLLNQQPTTSLYVEPVYQTGYVQPSVPTYYVQSSTYYLGPIGPPFRPDPFFRPRPPWPGPGPGPGPGPMMGPGPRFPPRPGMGPPRPRPGGWPRWP
jgi:hypothetical protein